MSRDSYVITTGTADTAAEAYYLKNANGLRHLSPSFAQAIMILLTSKRCFIETNVAIPQASYGTSAVRGFCLFQPRAAQCIKKMQ